MEQYILPVRIANAIMMDSSFNGYAIIVEGMKDSKLLNKYINKKSIVVKDAFGYRNVLEVMKILTSRNYEKRIGIVDSDFSQILNTTCDYPDIFYTDFHDIEVMLMSTRALENTVSMCCADDKIRNFEKGSEDLIRRRVFELATEVGYLKLANRIYNLGLAFKPKKLDGNTIKYKNFIDESRFVFTNCQAMVKTIINYSVGKSDKIESEEYIIESYHKLRSEPYDLFHLVNGHDLTNILYLFIKKTLKSNHPAVHDSNTLEDFLILAYDYEDFKRTNLYKSINQFMIEKNVSAFIE